MKLSTTKLSTKLYGTVGALALTGILAAGSAVWYIHTLGTNLTIATGPTAEKLALVNSIRAEAWKMVASLRGMVLSATLNLPEGIKTHSDAFDASDALMTEQVDHIRPLLGNDEGREELTEFEAALADFRRTAATYRRGVRDGRLSEAAKLSEPVRQFTGFATKSLDLLEDQQRWNFAESADRATQVSHRGFAVSAILAIVLVLISPAAGVIVRGTRSTLRNSANELAEGAAHVSSAAGKVAVSGQTFANASSDLAASLEETSASSEEINSMARKNSEGSASAVHLVEVSRRKFEDVNRALEATVRAVGQINDQSGKISKIIKTIDEIAFQTNILALNAAVEAARAGEAGMGFAVVADEVRNLAQRCAQAARDTASLIEDSIALSGVGQARVDEVGAAIRDVTGHSQQVGILVADVNMSSAEQARGIEQIGRAILQMQRITQQTAAAATDSADAAGQLHQRSAQLSDLVSRIGALVD